MNSDINKNISVWRGSQTPPTEYHIWIKDDNTIWLCKEDQWIENTAELSEEIENLKSSAVGKKTEQGGEIFNDYDSNIAQSYAHAEGFNTKANGEYSHSEGYGTTAAKNAHAEGLNTNAGQYGHTEGNETECGDTAHAEGYRTHASGIFSHTEGSETWAKGSSSHAEGYNNKADAENSHAEGSGTHVLGSAEAGHSEGVSTLVHAAGGHAEGFNCSAVGTYAHAEGYKTLSGANGSHTEGVGTETEVEGGHVEGTYNIKNDSVHVVGGGSSSERKNLHEIKKDGQQYILEIGGYNGKNRDDAKSLQEVINVDLKESISDVSDLVTQNKNTIDNYTINDHKISSNPSLSKTDIGLSNVTNEAQIPLSQKGAQNGVATLDSTGKIPSTQLPSYVDDVLEYDNYDSFPETGESGKIYIDKQENQEYRWGGSKYVVISKSIALGETSSTAYAGDKGKQLADKIQEVYSSKSVINSLSDITIDSDDTEGQTLSALNALVTWNSQKEQNDIKIPYATAQKAGVMSKDDKGKLDKILTNGTGTKYLTDNGTYASLNKSSVGLNNVDNTSDLNKPISTAVQKALDNLSVNLPDCPDIITNAILKTIDGEQLTQEERTEILNQYNNGDAYYYNGSKNYKLNYISVCTPILVLKYDNAVALMLFSAVSGAVAALNIVITLEETSYYPTELLVSSQDIEDASKVFKGDGSLIALKTINNQSLLGNGNIEISGSSSNIPISGVLNLTSGTTAITLGTIYAGLSNNTLKFYIVGDSTGTIPSDEGFVTVNDAVKLLIGAGGASVGDILIVGKLENKPVYKLLPLNDAKAASGNFPGADGLETVWDKTQINKIAGIETTANANNSLTRDGSNMNDCLQTGFYPWCTLGRPSGATGAFSLAVRRSSSADSAGFYTVEQTCFGREAELGQVYTRLVFIKSDGTSDFMDWVRIDSPYIEQTTGDSEKNVASQKFVTKYASIKRLNDTSYYFNTTEEFNSFIDSFFVTGVYYYEISGSKKETGLLYVANNEVTVQCKISILNDSSVDGDALTNNVINNGIISVRSYNMSSGPWGDWKTYGGTSVEVVQETGQSTTAVMSQKAVTDAINKIQLQQGMATKFIDLTTLASASSNEEVTAILGTVSEFRSEKNNTLYYVKSFNNYTVLPLTIRYTDGRLYIYVQILDGGYIIMGELDIVITDDIWGTVQFNQYLLQLNKSE